MDSITNLYYADYNTGMYLKTYDSSYPTVNILYTASIALKNAYYI